MTTESEIRDALRQWIAGASGNTDPEDLSDDTPLFRSGVLKSVQVSDLILYIEELAAHAIDVEQLKPGAFRDIDTIYRNFFARDMLDRATAETRTGDRDRGQTVLSGDLLTLDQRLDDIFTGWARCWNAAEYRFPACLEARHLARLDYFQSFPHLATFPVTLDEEHGNIAGFSKAHAHACEDGVALAKLAPTRHVLTPAACYHVYIELEGESLEAPRYVTTRATCFRNEREYTPLERQWNFSMREIVCLGSADEVEDFLTRSTRVINHFAAAVGLPVDWTDATDPFFSPAGNPKFLFQKLEPVKRELVLDDGLAIASTNFHRDYFGEAFRITRDGESACSGCVAFGMERWLAAFLRAFGESPDQWPRLDEWAK